jgi:hypothetical protein
MIRLPLRAMLHALPFRVFTWLPTPTKRSDTLP